MDFWMTEKGQVEGLTTLDLPVCFSEFHCVLLLGLCLTALMGFATRYPSYNLIPRYALCPADLRLPISDLRPLLLGHEEG
ncbi:MAG: hypothetical protein CVU64_23055 [Deltaproteobacteria bacterium HGW-Deltaproteobacteria-21]|nr:MAG: hypothetical protein CVU64_23055 [Deltaproteobacteria bacterium HGW-Deltaproteobacteria-21]